MPSHEDDTNTSLDLGERSQIHGLGRGRAVTLPVLPAAISTRSVGPPLVLVSVAVPRAPVLATARQDFEGRAMAASRI